MGKYLIIVILYLFSIKPIQSQKISDPNFAQAIRWACPNCIDSSNNLTTAAYALNSLTLLNDINDLTGIDAFVNLTSLNCADNKLTKLPTLPPLLRTLYCGNNKLTEVNNLPQNLTLLNCRGNQIKSLPPLPGNLRTLDCSINQLTSIPRLPTSLINFYCSYNSLAALPALPNTLATLGCANNKLSILPDLPKSLILLSCFENPALKCLPILPDSLQFLEISSTITCLPNLLPAINIFLYTGQTFRSATLPLCNIASSSPCYVSSISTDNFKDKIRIYPSPTEGGVFIESPISTILRVQVFNSTGQLMLQTQNSNFDISPLPKGIYYAKIEFDKYMITKKIVKI